jgi:predicted nucleotidyltransferase
MKLLPPDFRDFLKLLNRKRVRYLVVGGYAVGYHGYPRATGDIDIFIAISPRNAAAMVDVFREFGFVTVDLNSALFLTRGSVARIGRPPLRIEILNEIDGVRFDECHARREVARLDGLQVSLIGFEDLRKNKVAAGRPKDLADLGYLKAGVGRQRRKN